MSDELPQELIVLTHTHQLLAEATTIHDFKTLRCKAEAVRSFAKSVQLGWEVQVYAAELKLECERRAGTVLLEMNFASGGRPALKNRSQSGTSLEDLGIKKNQSSRWQLEARVPEAEFQRYLAESRAARREPTSQGLIRIARRLDLFVPSQARSPFRHQSSGKSHCQPMAPRSTSPAPGQGFHVSDDEEALIADLQNHHRHLCELLHEYCGTGRLDQPNASQRRYVGRLLREMGEFLSTLRLLRHGEATSSIEDD